MTISEIICEIFFYLLFIALPCATVILHWIRPAFFDGLGRKIIIWVSFSALSWILVVIGMFVGPPPENGFAYVCAFWAGWSYIWIFIIPIILLYILIRSTILGSQKVVNVIRSMAQNQ